MRIGAESVGKDVIDNVPRIPVKTAPADTIAIVDARIEDVIAFDFRQRKTPLQRGFLVNNETVLMYCTVWWYRGNRQFQLKIEGILG